MHMDETIFHTHAVRRLYRPDLQAFADHLIRLDPETRYNRYGLQVSDEYLHGYAEMCFQPGSIVYGWFEDHVLRGAAELRVFAARGEPLRKNGEAAFSVEKPWRRRGIGTELMGHVVLAARNRRIVMLSILCLRHNQAMLALARKFEADLEFELNDVTGHLVARPPSALSMWRELVDNTFDLGSAVLDLQGRVFKASSHAGR